MQKILISGIKAYQYILSPWLGPRCRYIPSCSQYTVEAITKHGALKGAALGALRVCRCHPLHKGGYDPVPDQ
jgi:putative membrane protein insertion efficiency factor